MVLVCSTVSAVRFSDEVRLNILSLHNWMKSLLFEACDS